MRSLPPIFQRLSCPPPHRFMLQAHCALHNITIIPFTAHASPLNTSSLSFLRFQIKESIRSYLRSHLSDDLCYALFASLATGEVENRLLRLQFNKVGLSHTLAISGFHYAWLIFLVGWTLQRFLSKRTTYSILLVIVSLYFFFIGASPALTRAWLAALIILFGFLFKQTVNGLNSLGLALLISLILDPLALFHIGFQFSYLATFALLTLHPYLSHRLPIHNSLLRSTLSLNIAVTLATLPLLLHHFHFFPFLSLFFNLFFPLALTVCLCALLIPFPWVLTLANWYTAPFLNAIYHGATPLEGGIYVARIPLDLLIALLVAIVTLGLLTKSDKTDYTLRIV